MRPAIVLFGDSITQQSFQPGGWGAALADAYSRQDSSKPPVAATIFFGANDAALSGRTSEHQHVPVDEYKENLKKIVHHLKKSSPTMLIVLITPPPVDEEGRNEYARSLHGKSARELPERTNEVTGTYAQQCVQLANELGVRTIDVWSKMQETEGWQKKFLSDGLHLTPEGNAVVYQEVVRVFSEAWLHAEEMPYDFPHHSEIDGSNPKKAFEQRCL
ncbi:GDSL esterase/lipase At5g62930 isoform X2 [Syzygium oleosum]|uniref:GDSL esterase/lipase At5g62930 isoform X2 n=1 Tax=Syzygium oleosum TaxID=219896 RepID=UPI0024BB3DC5|nr:GDSL esterase/lipase At5g62930 isoform X2 [Syzygium oleosum]